ncbi:hypothetical protein ColLi_13090 [Colletotrichum liriopes]|uniref:Uncharacterized protein n=1 Tax=Colletotrichum liriopes TaxID=708192 RepID=A0AA37LZ78_9PEZI|nr:hypothetical protein ColLi_13090 [Colletotrichum liriopes]
MCADNTRKRKGKCPRVRPCTWARAMIITTRGFYSITTDTLDLDSGPRFEIPVKACRLVPDQAAAEFHFKEHVVCESKFLGRQGVHIPNQAEVRDVDAVVGGFEPLERGIKSRRGTG